MLESERERELNMDLIEVKNADFEWKGCLIAGGTPFFVSNHQLYFDNPTAAVSNGHSCLMSSIGDATDEHNMRLRMIYFLNELRTTSNGISRNLISRHAVFTSVSRVELSLSITGVVCFILRLPRCRSNCPYRRIVV